jgi:hypothetical protein
VRLHARGGLGEVHVALDEELSRPVALKRIQRPRAADPESRRRFVQEAAITARLEHPGVVPVYGLVRDGSGQPCYAMRLIPGETPPAASPPKLQLRAELGECYTCLGDVEDERGSLTDALAWYDMAIGHLRGMLDEQPDYGLPREYLAAALFGRGHALARLGRPDRAMDALRLAVANGFRDLDRMRGATGLDPLRARDDFRLLLLDIALPSEPFARTR